jgi:hypothetical protein
MLDFLTNYTLVVCVNYITINVNATPNQQQQSLTNV